MPVCWLPGYSAITLFLLVFTQGPFLPAHVSLQGSSAKGVFMSHAKGTFEVKITPQTPDGKFEDATLGRMTIDKQFHGDIEGTSKGQMLTGMTEVKGSAGYVAMEKVTCKLQGRSGSFILQHSATMDRSVPALSVTVVPDSGTGELLGIIGKFNIIITDGKHSYEFEYNLPESH
jgi:hypothetical protein